MTTKTRANPSLAFGHEWAQLVGPDFPLGQPFDPVYAAPERVAAASKGEACPASAAVDAWGLGMTLYWLVSGRDYVRDGTGGEGTSLNHGLRKASGLG